MSLMSSHCEVSSIARAQRNTMSQSRSNLVDRLSPAVLRGLQDSVIELTAEHPDDADYSKIVIGARLEKKLKTSMASAIKVHGLRKSLSDGPHSGMCSGVFVPYQDHLDLLALGRGYQTRQGRFGGPCQRAQWGQFRNSTFAWIFSRRSTSRCQRW